MISLKVYFHGVHNSHRDSLEVFCSHIHKVDVFQIYKVNICVF
jgi:hypothetical protein